jgi:hypothetical protein
VHDPQLALSLAVSCEGFIWDGVSSTSCIILSYLLTAQFTAPTIITTAPTSSEIDQPVKQRSKRSLLPSRKHSMEELSRNSVDNPRTKPMRKKQGSTDSQIGESSLSNFQTTPEEPGRLSTTSRHSGSRDQLHDSHRSSVIDPRFSESSRSDQSYGDQTLPNKRPSRRPSICIKQQAFPYAPFEAKPKPAFPFTTQTDCRESCTRQCAQVSTGRNSQISRLWWCRSDLTLTLTVSFFSRAGSNRCTSSAP